MNSAVFMTGLMLVALFFLGLVLAMSIGGPNGAF